jgi:hypothetical protein
MGDDLAKSPHMANIGGSVYHDVPREGYWVDRDDNPSPLMKQSLLYKLHTYKIHKNSNPAIEKCVPCGWAVACVCGVCVWRVCVACVCGVCVWRVCVACVCGVCVWRVCWRGRCAT